MATTQMTVGQVDKACDKMLDGAGEYGIGASTVDGVVFFDVHELTFAEGWVLRDTRNGTQWRGTWNGKRAARAVCKIVLESNPQ